MEKVLPLAHKYKTKLITNMGAANPIEAMNEIAKLAKALQIKDLKIAAVVGDDISDKIHTYLEYPIMESGLPLRVIKDQIVSANAYLGCDGIVEALKNDADIIVTGRVADPSLFLAPMVFEFGWTPDEFTNMGIGTLVGHLLECAGQVTGGYFADPGKKEVPDLWNLGFPYVEIDALGNGYITKLPEAGGMVTPATCTEQLLYEIHDPENYITPDCVANFSKVVFKSIGKDKVQFSGASSKPATDTFKVSVGYENGFIGEGEISYGGANCLNRALLALEVVKKRLEMLPFAINDLRCELIGVNSLVEHRKPTLEPNEVRLRVAGRTAEKQQAQRLANEVETLYTNGPAGGGGATKRIEEIIAIASILVPKKDVETNVHYLKI
jgi:hypothetical protein